MITDMAFEGADEMQDATVAAAAAVSRLRNDARAAQVPVVYVNENFGEWHSQQSRIVDRCLEANGVRDIVEPLVPADDDYFIIKPQFSGFYATNLPVLLPKLGVSRLILTGIAADVCVLFTAADAHMRDYELWIPEDTVAARTAERRHWALEIMRAGMKAEIRSTNEFSLADWLDRVED